MAFVVLALIGLATGGYFFFQYQKTNKELQNIKTDPSILQKAAQEDIKKLVAEVGKLIVLPEGEDPTVATVTDIEKLKNEVFFQKAKNGDKVLIYTQAKKAILFRESQKKIIEVAPINIGTSSATQSQAQQQTKVALRNGTAVAGAAAKIEAQLKGDFPQVEIVSKTDASGNYDTTVIVVLNESAKTVAGNLVKTLGGAIGGLPSEESKPSGADILVLIGEDLANQ